MNSFEPKPTETEFLELEVEQRDSQTDSQTDSQIGSQIESQRDNQIGSQTDSQSDNQTVTPVSVPAPKTGLECETPIKRTEFSETFEPVSLSQISSELAYSCLLIPRFSDHYMTGDITIDLLNWMREICISYGWRLDAITIRPGYLQWIMTVPLTANPAQFMRITRQQTSLKILEYYPRYKIKNISSDFWAPGFSVVHGNSLQSLDDINSYILQIRKQQGIF
jgi:REP element-mobilizing transposase RayT